MTWSPRRKHSLSEWVNWLTTDEIEQLKLLQLALARSKADASRLAMEIQTLRVRAASRRNRHKASNGDEDQTEGGQG